MLAAWKDDGVEGVIQKENGPRDSGPSVGASAAAKAG
jgi:hypothetical protein